jgi:hypothetical protein
MSLLKNDLNKMKRPKRLDFTAEEIESLISRIENQSLEVDDFPLLADLVRAMIWMGNSLREKSLSILRLKAIFGIKTESAKKLKGLLKLRKKGAEEKSDENESEDNMESTSSDEEMPRKEEKSEGGHGHRPSSDYQEAELIRIAHEVLKKGSIPLVARGNYLIWLLEPSCALSANLG